MIFRYHFMLIITGFMITASSFSQRCMVDQIRNQNIIQNPSLVDTIKKIELFTQKWIDDNNHKAKRQSVITIPVVVHVLWRVDKENISDEQIMSQIEILNTDFRKQNANFSNTPTAFQGISADTEIEFCLASIRPSGESTTGITRTQTTVNNIGATDYWFRTSNGGKTPWDVTKYVNIWVCDIGNDGTLGFATLPGTAWPDIADGLVIGHQYFGNIGTAVNSAPNHLGRTTTHEMGHYLNLEHLWGPYNGSCTEDDFVDDTPNQEGENYDCPSFPEFDNCSSTGNGINYSNYLGYADDECMTMFTEGQKLRMLATLNGPRKGLLSSNGCKLLTTVNDTKEEKNTLQIYPNPAREIVTFSYSKSRVRKESKVRMVDLLGNTIQSFDVHQQKTINLNNIKAGTYFIFIDSNPKKAYKLLVL